MRKSHKFLSLAALLTGSAFLFFYEKHSDDADDEMISLPAITEDKPDIASITDVNEKKRPSLIICVLALPLKMLESKKKEGDCLPLKTRWMNKL
ncbi:hypothetical protein JCM19235_2683 [Vibrio maritimus]|uniref:Uncharacterized protein n=1 Tax=Vibrio maritimus TaxID=990268 RepID=A0A090RUX7_9VIBR|nr:hypothetical protein JCM19235_2683 [Vibrio maritimus]